MGTDGRDAPLMVGYDNDNSLLSGSLRHLRRPRKRSGSKVRCMMTVTQEQAYNMRNVLRTESKTTGKFGQKIAKLTITEGTLNLIDYLLEQIEKGELVEVSK